MCEHRSGESGSPTDVVRARRVGGRAARVMLAECRMLPDDESDLSFYFRDAATLIGGIRSTLGPAIDALRLGHVPEHGVALSDDVMVARLDGVERVWRVHRVLVAVGARLAMALELVHGADAEMWPAHVRSRFGRLAGVALWLGGEEVARRSERAGGKRAEPGDGIALERARVEAEQLVSEAERAYSSHRVRLEGERRALHGARLDARVEQVARAAAVDPRASWRPDETEEAYQRRYALTFAGGAR